MFAVQSTFGRRLSAIASAIALAVLLEPRIVDHVKEVVLMGGAATVPGNRITDLQMTKYKELRGKHTQEAAAAKSGISVSSAQRIE